MLLSPEWFQITALKGKENMQQGISDKYDFYKWIKEVNQINKELE